MTRASTQSSSPTAAAATPSASPTSAWRRSRPPSSARPTKDRLVANVQMTRAQAHELAPVVVRGQQRPQQMPRPEAGNTERLLSSGQTTRMPVDAGNLNDLATLAPGVIGIAGTDSTPQAFSVAGQPHDQNSITLDGLSYGRR